MSSIVLPEADPGIARISATLAARLRSAFPLPSFKGVPKETRDAARRFWSQRAWSEYCALPVLNQISLKLLAQNAPLDELASVSGILQDEALHTALSVEVAEAFGGYTEDVPDYLHFDVEGMTNPSTLPLAIWVAVGLCVGETVSRALIQARLKKTKHPALRALIARTLKDENVHVAFGWAAARRAVASLSPSDKDSLLPWCQQALEDVWTGPSVRLLKGKGQHIERRQRQRVADAGLGSCTPEEEDASVLECVTHFIVPSFAKMGLRGLSPGR